MPRKTKRRRWSAEDKLRIVLAGLEPDMEVSELCRREGINPTQYYGRRNPKQSTPPPLATAGCRDTVKL